MLFWSKRRKNATPTEKVEYVYEDPPPLSAEQQQALNAANALFDSAFHDDVTRVTELLDAGTPIDAVGDRGLPALYAAIENDATAAMRLLLDRGASVHQYAGSEDWKPLSHAVEGAVLYALDGTTPKTLQTSVIELLCELGASPDVVGSPLHTTPRKYAELLATEPSAEAVGRELLAIFDQHR